MFTFFDPNCDLTSGLDPPEVDSSCKGLARGAGCDEARPRDETWIQESLLTKVVDKVEQWTLPFQLCLLWQDIDVVAGDLSPCFQPASAGQQAVQGFGQCFTLIATLIANSLLRQWNKVRTQMKCNIYTRTHLGHSLRQASIAFRIPSSSLAIGRRLAIRALVHTLCTKSG